MLWAFLSECFSGTLFNLPCVYMISALMVKLFYEPFRDGPLSLCLPPRPHTYEIRAVEPLTYGTQPMPRPYRNDDATVVHVDTDPLLPPIPCHLLQTIPRTETCGGTDAFDLYKLEWADAPVNHPEYMECYADMKGDRVMGHKITTDDMTPAVCREHCMGKDAMYYGTQVSVCLCFFSFCSCEGRRHVQASATERVRRAYTVGMRAIIE